MRRMIARNTTDGTQRVHFVWMHLPDSNFVSRYCAYRVWNPVSGEFDCDGDVPGDVDQYMGYCVVDVTNDDLGIPAGHNNEFPTTGGVNQFQAWVEDAAGACDFYDYVRAGGVTHSTTSDAGAWDSGPIDVVYQYAVAFEDTVGIYPYHCKIAEICSPPNPHHPPESSQVEVVPDTTSDPKVVEVVITHYGFNPDPVSIELNDTVLWINGDSCGDCLYVPSAGGPIWPAMCWQEGVDTILHVFAQESRPDAGAAQPVAYFRCVNPLGDAIWDIFRCVDTVHTLAQDCDCTDEGKVAIAWTANLPKPGETASSNDYWAWSQRNNDVWVQVSNDGGCTWDPRINVTNYQEDGEDGFRAFTDLSLLIDSNDSVHVVWNALYWPGDAEATGSLPDIQRARIFHWSGISISKDPNDINVVHDANWVGDSCSVGAWNLNASKMTISECDGKMYIVFVQYNDENADPPVVNDCAVEGSPGGYRGRANGELYLCVSDNWGDNWDRARNLTRSRTPACTLVAGDPRRGNCESDNWPSMVKFGTNYAGSWPEILVEIPPDSPYTGDYFLDIQYVNDNSAGGIVQNEGWWTQSDVKWFRIGCVEPVAEANLIVNPTEIGYPTWTKHGVQRNETIALENIGNCDLSYTATKFETTPPLGWLSVAPGGGNIAAGGNDLLTVGLNVGGIVNTPGTIVHLLGSLYVDWQGIGTECPPNENQREVVPIECWVTDTLYEPVWDTIHTACTKLIVANTGNFGKTGEGKVNMDYYDDGDCDTTAEVYLYDGSPVIGYQKNGGTDTMVNFSIFGTSYINENGFIPLGDHTPTTDMGEYEVFETGKFVTNDSLIAIEKIWYAPTPPVGYVDTCSFVIQCMKIYLNDTLADPPTDVRIGEAIDWDIPADSNSRNYSGFDWPLRLLWQQGSEEDGEGCQANDLRWGGIDFLEVYRNGHLIPMGDSLPYGGYIMDNETQVYPEGGFVPDSLYKYMGNSGFAPSDTQNTDLHMVMTKIVLDVLLKTDTIVIYEEIVSHHSGTYEKFLDEVRASKQWYIDHIKPEGPTTCCNHDGLRGDYNSDSAINVGDLGLMVDFLFFSGAPPTCCDDPGPPAIYPEADFNGDGAVNVGDLGLLVDYLFFSGPDPAPCPSK
jgi:hypothetical protein